MKNKKVIGIVAIVILLAIPAILFLRRPKAQEPTTPIATPKPQVNLIPVSERPYVTLQPLNGRNELELTIHDLKKQAESVEVAVEYDRNKGVDDAVLYSYTLSEIPYSDKIFLGSRSAGGHITYHDDVIGGKIRFDFQDEDYSLETPWRYDDTQTSYDALSTADGKFQLTLDDPIRQSKVVVMTSPGLPAEIEGELLAGPYYIGTVGKLPDTQAQLTARLDQEASSVAILGWDGEAWQEFEATVDGKNVTATVDLMDTFVIVSK